MTDKEIIASDETGYITRHYENCVNCGGKGTLKVYECHFRTSHAATDKVHQANLLFV